MHTGERVDITEVRRHDKYLTEWTASGDITGADVRLIARRGADDPIFLANTVFDAANGVVHHRLDGTLDVGDYEIELEIKWPDGDEMSVPRSNRPILRVTADLA